MVNRTFKNNKRKGINNLIAVIEDEEEQPNDHPVQYCFEILP